MALSKTTRDHDEIRKWAESHGAVPSEVASTETDGEPGILRFQFPKAKQKNDDRLQEIPWEDFFRKFDENNLELVTRSGLRTAARATSTSWCIRRAEKAAATEGSQPPEAQASPQRRPVLNRHPRKARSRHLRAAARNGVPPDRTNQRDEAQTEEPASMNHARGMVGHSEVSKG